MSYLDDILKSRRDTRHFTTDEVPDEVIQKALQAGHWAPSVGLTDATRYYIIKSKEVKTAVKELFLDYNKKAEELTNDPARRRRSRESCHRTHPTSAQTTHAHTTGNLVTVWSAPRVRGCRWR